MAAENATTGITNATLVTTAETVVATLPMPPINEPAGQGIFITGAADVTAGAGSTGLNLRVRIGSLTGTQVGATVGVSAAGNGVIGVIDTTTNYPAGVTYVLTAQQVAATGNGTVLATFLDATPISNFGG